MLDSTPRALGLEPGAAVEVQSHRVPPVSTRKRPARAFASRESEDGGRSSPFTMGFLGQRVYDDAIQWVDKDSKHLDNRVQVLQPTSLSPGIKGHVRNKHTSRKSVKLLLKINGPLTLFELLVITLTLWGRITVRAGVVADYEPAFQEV